ncbi:MAG TPA: Gfo/Idh/MocA family oxidoreductase [Chthoniobacterales bacterium]|nr:Gfo/Idh/MocA family oxidoreductase [Chthoniobacterales bacterium]
MNKKLKLGIIGAGWPGQMHAQALRASGVADLYACADPDDARRIVLEKEHAPERSYRDYHELLKDRHVDGAIICLPNFLHFPASLAALESGKHVLCEKPPTMNAAEMKVLWEEATKRDLVYFFSRQFRFTPAMRLAKALVEEGRLGKIYHAKATFVRSRGIPVGIGNWFTEKKRSGGGALIDIGVHALDSVWYLMGTPRPASVSAQVFRNFDHLVKVSVFDVEDAAYAFIRFEDGAVVQLEASWAGNLPDDIPPRKYFGRELINSTIFGTKGTVRLNPLTLFEDKNGELVTVPLAAKEDEPNGFELQLRNFVGSINGESEPINNADQAVSLMEMIDAIYASSAAGREVPIVAW